jgi:flagellar biosynthesis protein FlhA
VVEDLVPKLLPLSLVQKILQNLLRERVSIRDSVSILEALGEGGQVTKNPVLLTEYVRQAIRRMVVRPYLAATGELAAYFLDPALEQAIESAIEHGEHASHLNLAPQRMRDIIDRLAKKAGPADAPVLVLAASPVRYFLRQMVEASFANLQVLAHGEVPAGVRVVSLGLVQ